MEDKVIKIEVSIWAASDEEGAALRKALVDFINEHAAEGRRVTARKVTEALSRWKSNPIVRTGIINYFK